ncbi:MAG: ATP-binding cassette domain-containing protein [Phycisphaeraceae bacterium]
MIRFREVSKRYGDGDAPPAVDRLSLEVRDGELLVLLGESGCGKTTTLKMINRLIEPTGGRIELDGQDVQRLDAVALRRKIGYVFQGIGLFPHLSVAENVAVVPRLLGWPRRQIAERVDELLALVNLPAETMRDRNPAELSGGQQQRVGVARALAARPRIMLMDEPFGALDPLTRDALQEEYRRLHEELGLTTVMVTHDMTEALLLADRIAVMRTGRLIGLGTPAELLTAPGHADVAAMMQTPRRHAARVEALAGGG